MAKRRALSDGHDLPYCSCSPRQRPGRDRWGGLVSGGFQKASGELACDGDRDHTGRLVALLARVQPALVEPQLRAPGDRDERPSATTAPFAHSTVGDVATVRAKAIVRGERASAKIRHPGVCSPSRVRTLLSRTGSG
jgi:hypothetical protein